MHLRRLFDDYEAIGIPAEIKESVIGVVNLTQYNSYHFYHYYCNISLGTPPQDFMVEVDFWRRQDLSVLDSKTNISRADDRNPPKHIFNSSTSLTYFGPLGNFADLGSVGYIGSDVANIGGISITDFKFGLVTSLNWQYTSEPVDGTLGISPHESYNGISNALTQIAEQLDTPVVSLWNNGNDFSNGTGQLTLGALDNDHCQPDSWFFVPRPSSQSMYPIIYGIHVPRPVFYQFSNATNATYKPEWKLWAVDCDLSKARDVTFYVGGQENKISGEDKAKLVVVPEDYIGYKAIYKTCFLRVSGYDPPEGYPYSKGYDEIIFGQWFMSRYCIAYNVQSNEVGFAKVKPVTIRGSNHIPLTQIGNLLCGNISIGTPPQKFLVEVDLWWSQDLSVIGSKANLKDVAKYLPPKQTFNGNVSSTFVVMSGNFSDYGGDGNLGQDVIYFGESSSLQIAFGVITKLSWHYENEPIDGTLGLSPQNSSNGISDVLSQIGGQLDEPTFSFWSNINIYGNGTGQLTIGAEDPVHCQPNWVDAPRVSSSSSPYGVNVQRASGNKNGQYSRVNINATFSISPNTWSPRISAPKAIFDLLINVSNAKYNESNGFWQVDCDLSAIGSLVLEIGNIGGNESKELQLTAADFIRYSTYYQICYADVYNFNSDNQVIEVGENFLNNHCIAYNLRQNLVGFADVQQKFIKIF
ncbi:eukaryotic aspartyl protease domain-containing protein [Ditylenchus destructor]|uniref:Eukaryotic aspartyl protease domain-containing protein n=1 Tax=Ditylenchus destructor TaxID=166010 RepID=A0AAD4MJS0_9BILA|nr:eukaryotic aspartyl protease domain-containing protein [Ditylenchus destructor]